VAVVAILAAAAGCATPAPVEVPAELPLVTNDQFFELRWALERGPDRTRAVGRAKPSTNTEFWLTLDLFGLDAEGRIVSRGTTYARSRFNRDAAPFAVEVASSGREARYELRVVDYYVAGIRAH
jgi:hypothetical protein